MCNKAAAHAVCKWLRMEEDKGWVLDKKASDKGYYVEHSSCKAAIQLLKRDPCPRAEALANYIEELNTAKEGGKDVEPHIDERRFVLELVKRNGLLGLYQINVSPKAIEGLRKLSKDPLYELPHDELDATKARMRTFHEALVVNRRRQEITSGKKRTSEGLLHLTKAIYDVVVVPKTKTTENAEEVDIEERVTDVFPCHPRLRRRKVYKKDIDNRKQLLKKKAGKSKEHPTFIDTASVIAGELKQIFHVS